MNNVIRQIRTFRASYAGKHLTNSSRLLSRQSSPKISRRAHGKMSIESQVIAQCARNRYEHVVLARRNQQIMSDIAHCARKTVSEHVAHAPGTQPINSHIIAHCGRKHRQRCYFISSHAKRLARENTNYQPILENLTSQMTVTSPQCHLAEVHRDAAVPVPSPAPTQSTNTRSVSSAVQLRY